MSKGTHTTEFQYSSTNSTMATGMDLKLHEFQINGLFFGYQNVSLFSFEKFTFVGGFYVRLQTKLTYCVFGICLFTYVHTFVKPRIMK